jgi:hypothetical protein
MVDIILIIASYLVTFLLGRIWGLVEAKKRIIKILKEYKVLEV